MKFKIIPNKHHILITIVNPDWKTKGVNRWVTASRSWGHIERSEIDSKDIPFLSDCKSKEEIEKKLNDKIKSMQSINKNSHARDLYKNENYENVYDIYDIAENVGIDADYLLCENAGGMASTEIIFSNNVNDDQLKESKNFDGEEITLEQALIDGRDDIISSWDFDWEEDEYYELPLKIEQTV